MRLKYEKRYHENCIVPKRVIKLGDKQVKEELYKADALTDSNIEKLSNGNSLDLGDFSIIPIGILITRKYRKFLTSTETSLKSG